MFYFIYSKDICVFFTIKKLVRVFSGSNIAITENVKKTRINKSAVDFYCDILPNEIFDVRFIQTRST